MPYTANKTNYLRDEISQAALFPLGVDRIGVKVSYDPKLIEQFKTISEHRWHPAEKTWSFPAEANILTQLVQVLQRNTVTIDPTLRDRFTTTPKLDTEKKEPL